MTFTAALILALARYPWLENGQVEHLGEGDFERTRECIADVAKIYFVSVDNVETKVLSL